MRRKKIAKLFLGIAVFLSVSAFSTVAFVNWYIKQVDSGQPHQNINKSAKY